MTNPAAVTYPAIAGCSSCRFTFFMTGPGERCLTCGNPPDFALPFDRLAAAAAAGAVNGPETVEEPSAEALSIGVPCPHGDGVITISVTELAVAVQSHEPPIGASPAHAEAGAEASPDDAPSAVPAPHVDEQPEHAPGPAVAEGAPAPASQEASL